MLIEGNDIVAEIKKDIIISTGFLLITLTITFFASRKISKMIVKPVKEATDKQSLFVSNASHELKTPLAVIRANIELLENEKGKSKWIDFTQNEIDSMNKMVSELLLLSKIENIGKTTEIEKRNVSEDMELICSMFESVAYEKKINYNINIQEDIWFNITKADIEHISSTLIDNAIKHTKENEKVIINLKKEKEHIKLEVINQGREIPIEERKKIFERFYRIDKSRNRKERRFGLGLAIAKSLVEKYNGTIDVDCESGYTKFIVKI